NFNYDCIDFRCFCGDFKSDIVSYSITSYYERLGYRCECGTMAAIYFYARERYYDPNYCLLNTTFYNKGVIPDSNGLVCDRYSSLFRSTKFFAVDGRKGSSSIRCWYYHAFNANNFVYDFPDRKTWCSDGNVRNGYCFCSCNWPNLIRVASGAVSMEKFVLCHSSHYIDRHYCCILRP